MIRGLSGSAGSEPGAAHSNWRTSFRSTLPCVAAFTTGFGVGGLAHHYYAQPQPPPCPVAANLQQTSAAAPPPSSSSSHAPSQLHGPKGST